MKALAAQSPHPDSHPASLLRGAAVVAVLCLATVAAMRWFWRFGPPNDVDMVIGIFRVFEANEAWRTGFLYARIGPDLNFSYGSPMFQYYPPLVSYLALLLHWMGFGWVEAAKAACTLLVFAGGMGAYRYARALFGGREAALLSALAFMLAPYLLDAVVNRSANAEALGWAILPWLAWSLHRLLDPTRANQTGRWILVTGAFFALVTLAHNIVILFSLPVLIAYAILSAWQNRTWRRLAPCALALLLGLGLSAFYWLPALAEGSHGSIDSRVVGSFHPVQQLTDVATLIQGKLDAVYWGPVDKRLALWQTLGVILAVLLVPTQPRKWRPVLIFMILILVLALFLQTRTSAAFWINVPLAKFIQFSWRLLGLAAFCVAILIGSIMESRLLASRPLRWAVWLLLAGLILFGSLRNLRPPMSPTDAVTRSDDIRKETLFELGRSYYPLFSDYLPATVRVDPPAMVLPRPAHDPVLPALQAAPSVQVRRERFTEMVLDVSAKAPFTIRFHRIYVPGFQVYVSGQPMRTGPDGPFGQVSAGLPAGQYEVVLKYEDTSLRALATRLSLASVIIGMIGGAVLARRRPWVLIGAGVLVGGLVIFGFLHIDRSEAPRRPTAQVADFRDAARLLGYHIPAGPWHPGDTVPVRLYWFADRSPDINYKVFLHLSRPEDSGHVAQSDSEPILGASSMTRWAPGEIIVDEQHLKIGDEVEPGRYRLLLGLYDPATVQNVRVTEASEVWPGDRLPLAEVDVTNR